MLLTGDRDLNTVGLQTLYGGNGDYYIRLKFKIEHGKNKGLFDNACVRIVTSGGNHHPDIQIAVANLHRAMEKHGFNGDDFK